MFGHDRVAIGTCPRYSIYTINCPFITLKSTRYAKIMTDAKKYGLFDNIRFPQVRLHCKYQKKNSYTSECPEITGENLL